MSEVEPSGSGESRMRSRWALCLLGALAPVFLLMIGAEPDPIIPPGPLIPTISPVLQRCELVADEERFITFILNAESEATISAVETDCRCISVVTPLPVSMKAGNTPLRMRVTGVISGLKTVTVRTTAGTITAYVQVVSNGLGRGVDAMQQVFKVAVRDRRTLCFILHDLHGEIRNCGCSGGSLGGIDHLAALPPWAREQAPDIAMRFIITGDSDGSTPGVGNALRHTGWSSAKGDIIVSDDPTPWLTAPEVIAIICTQPPLIQHRRLIRPLLTGGMTIEALLLDETDAIVEHAIIPIDRSLPLDAKIIARFLPTMTLTIDHSAIPSTNCISCHRSSHDQWSVSRHAAAWTSLHINDHRDDCVRCHSTPLTSGALAPGVHCQACHLGADAHAATPSVPTAGTTDCRSCHSARNDSKFDPVQCWKIIAHGTH